MAIELYLFCVGHTLLPRRKGEKEKRDTSIIIFISGERTYSGIDQFHVINLSNLEHELAV